MRTMVFGLLICLTGVFQLAEGQELSGETERSIYFNIPAQQLESALTTFADQSNYRLVYRAEMAAGKSTTGVEGTYRPEEAIGKLLEGTGLRYRLQDAKTITLEKGDTSEGAAMAGIAAGTGAAAGGAAAAGTQSARKKKSVKVDEVVVRDVRDRGEFKPLREEGTAEEGYRVESASFVGPLGRMKILDAPYSINVMSRNLIDNLQAVNPDQLFRINPSTQWTVPNNRGGQTDVTVRGFFSPAVSEDGLRSTVFRMDIEDKERVEVLNGLTGFLFGPNNPGGMINYVLKRPTPYYLNSVKIGNAGGTNFYTHGDFGGPIDKAGRFGYRINVLAQDGDLVVDDSRLRRGLLSAAFDAQITKDILLQFEGSYSEYKSEGIPPTWIFIPGVPHPRAPDNKQNWGQPYTNGDNPIAKAGASLTYNINETFTLRSGFKYIDENRRNYLLTNNLSVENGSYIQLIFRNVGIEEKTKSAYAFLDARLNTFSIEHQITAGFYGMLRDAYEPPDRSSLAVFPGLPFTNPTFIPEPDLPAGNLPKVRTNSTEYTNFIIGDHLRWGESFSAIVGVNYARIKDTAWDVLNPSQVTDDYDSSKVTPAVSVIYKPLPMVSTYATYIEGLERGAVAPLTAANALAVLPPLKSEQYEIGTKVELGGALLTAALFRIDKANQFLDPADNIFKQEGRQVHDGIELGVSGKVLHNLTLWGGATFLRARITENQADPRLNGKRPIGVLGVSEQMAKLYAEYAIDAVPGLYATGGVYYVGSFYSDPLNTDKLPSYVTGDVGSRYTAKIYDIPTTFRVNVTNVTNKNYWLSSQYTGYPLAVMFSVQALF